MNHVHALEDMRVDFLYKDKLVCTMYCKNYSEMIKFLQFCKDYEVELWPHEFMELTEEKKEWFGGVPGYVYDFWYQFGDDKCLQVIKVELGGDDYD